MSLPIIRRIRTTQPQSVVPVDRDNPILTGVNSSIIIYGDVGGWTYNNGVLIQQPAISGALASGVTNAGSAFVFNGTSTYLDFGTANIPTAEFTLLWGGVFDANGSPRGFIDCTNNGVSGWNIYQDGVDGMYFNNSSYPTGNPTTGWTVGKFWHGALRNKGGVSADWFRDGIQLTSGTGVSPTAPTLPFWLGRLKVGGLPYLQARFSYLYLFDKYLDGSAIKRIAENPWQIFEPQKRVVFVSASSGSTGTVNSTNASDTASASGTTTVTGSLAKTNSSDSVSASGTTSVVGTLARTNASDTLAASGSVGQVTGTVARTEASDTSSATGTTTVVGTVAKTVANDAVSASGKTTVKGSSATANTSDSCAASGSIGNAVSGSVNRTNANDSIAASGTTTVAGTVSKSDSGDSVAASGFTLVSGSLAKADSNDIVVSLGTTTILGLLARANGSDSIAASGTVGDVTEITSTVERTVIFNAVVAKTVIFRPTKSVTVKFH
jgi:hypothetical protein